MRGSAFFDGIDQVDVTTRGHATKTPTFYYDAALMEATFPARLGELRSLMPDPRVVPMRLAPGVGAVTLSCFEYRDSDLGPYNEVAVSVLICDREFGWNAPGRQLAAVLRRRQGHAFVLHLPVTTEPALALGVDFYNFPKFLAGIEFADTAHSRRCHLAEGSEPILTITARRLVASGRRTSQSFAHLWMDGQPQRAEVRMNQLAYGTSFRPGAAQVSLGDRHPIALELDRLLLSRRSIGFDFVPRQEAVLFGPEHLTVALVRRALGQAAAAEPVSL
jgi:hypothetical protein